MTGGLANKYAKTKITVKCTDHTLNPVSIQPRKNFIRVKTQQRI